MDKQTFYIQKVGYAKQAQSGTGLPVSVILAQWADESAYGTSKLALVNNNLGGIKHSAYTINSNGADSQGFAMYNSLGAFVSDYVHFLHGSNYANVLTASKTESSNDVAIALGRSPYDSAHYDQFNGTVGSSITHIMIEDGLVKSYDKQQPITGQVKKVPSIGGASQIYTNSTTGDFLKKWGIPLVILLVIFNMGSK